MKNFGDVGIDDFISSPTELYVGMIPQEA